MPTPANANDFHQFLKHLHRGGNYSYWWTLEDRQSEWWPVGGHATVPNGGRPEDGRKQNHYFGLHPTTDLPDNPIYSRSRIATIAAINCLFGEFDPKDTDDEEQKQHLHNHIRQLHPPPSVIIDSGGGYHVYWLLKEPFILSTNEDRERARHLQAQWVVRIGSDASSKDLARVLRIPGTDNYKYDPARPVQIVSADLNRTYALSDLEALVAFTLHQVPAEQVRASEEDGREPRPTIATPERLLNDAFIKVTPSSRNDTGFWLACQLRDNGYDKTAAWSVMLEYQTQIEALGDHEYGQKEAMASLQSAYEGHRREAWGGSLGPQEAPVAVYLSTLDPETSERINLPLTNENVLAEIEKLTYRKEAESWAWEQAETISHLPPSTWGRIAYALRQKGMTVRDINDWKGTLREHHKEEKPGGNVVIHTTDDYVEALEELGYSFRMNESNNLIEVNGEPLSDMIAAKIRAQMRDKGFKHIKAFEDAYIAGAYDSRYHPVREYLLDLHWDGKDHIAALAAHFSDEHKMIRYDDGVQRTIIHAWLRRWLAGSVAKVVDREQNMMLVLDGAQRKGKSFFVRWLASPLPDYFIEAPVKPEDKDSLVRLISNWVWEVAELGATTRKADHEALKHFITMRMVTVRKSYGRHDIIKPAMASLIGTINNETGFLVDNTGNRRYLSCTLTDIDWSYTDLDVSQVWAQAVALWQMGETGRLTHEEMACQDAMNPNYEMELPAESWVLRVANIDASSSTFTASVDLVNAIQEAGWRGSTAQLTREMGKVLVRMGAERVRGNRKGKRVRGYLGVELTYDPPPWGDE